MKAVYLFLFILVLIPLQVCNAQVGINTDPKPGTTLHVKTDKGDVIVDSNTGNLGINTDNPQEKLHVEGNSKISGNVNVEKNIMVNGKTAVDGTVTNVKTPDHVPTAALEIVKDPTNPGLPAGKIDGGDFVDGHVLVGDSLGNASWTALRPDFKIVGIDENGDLLPLYTTKVHQVVYTSGPEGAGYTDITNNALELEKGRWLILAKYSTRANIETNAWPDMLYTRLMSYPKGEPGKIKMEAVFGIQPEQSGYSVCLPSLFYITYVDKTTIFRIYAKPIKHNIKLFSDRTGSYFCAIKLGDR